MTGCRLRIEHLVTWLVSKSIWKVHSPYEGLTESQKEIFDSVMKTARRSALVRPK